MSTIIELDWENQNAVSAYPFTQISAFNNIIVDASFQQFDNFIPTMNYLLISSNSITVNITYDKGTGNFILEQSDYNDGLNFIRMFDSTRYIGRLTFGTAVTNLWNLYVGQKIDFDLQFVATTVRSIASSCGVFSIASLYGSVGFNAAVDDETVFFNTNNSSNFITFNAVGNYKLPGSPPTQALKLLNLMAPINNNIFFSSSDVIQINGDGIGSLNIALVGSQPISNETKIVTTPGF
jgi:hypothetical protein